MRSLGMAMVGGTTQVVTAGARAIEERATRTRSRFPTVDFLTVFRFLLVAGGIACGVIAVWHTWGFGAGLGACAVGAFAIEAILRPETDKPPRRH